MQNNNKLIIEVIAELEKEQEKLRSETVKLTNEISFLHRKNNIKKTRDVKIKINQKLEKIDHITLEIIRIEKEELNNKNEVKND